MSYNINKLFVNKTIYLAHDFNFCVGILNYTVILLLLMWSIIIHYTNIGLTNNLKLLSEL